MKKLIRKLFFDRRCMKKLFWHYPQGKVTRIRTLNLWKFSWGPSVFESYSARTICEIKKGLFQ